MAKVTKKSWIESVVSYLSKKNDNDAKQLLQQHVDLESLAERKRESAKKRRLMNKINNKETVKIEKTKLERLREINAELTEIIR